MLNCMPKDMPKPGHLSINWLMSKWAFITYPVDKCNMGLGISLGIPIISFFHFCGLEH